ncbi:MAG: LD-carboxypeptidase, partial [Synechococcales cyanobacterium T60_A2020_003]|nr:LD-carboxypeptidase [Synechococcales cyanobacterium T60_A2020_003]
MRVCVPPAPLEPGDLLYVVSPSGALREREAFYHGVDVWRSRGFQVKFVPGFDTRWGYLAGEDDHRRDQIKAALADPDCRGILCSRGGYGGARVLEHWNWEGLDPNCPKWLIGFSDITALLWSLSHQGIAGVHAPVLTTLATEPGWSVQRLFDWVSGQALPPLQGKSWVGGTCEGVLLPANLTVATHLLCTPVQPDLENVILALEDVSEAPYRIDRMLTQWRMSGQIQKVRGIALGRFSQCDSPNGIPSFSVDEVLRDRLSDLGIPVVSDLPFGHDGVNAALPVGIMAQLDGD